MENKKYIGVYQIGNKWYSRIREGKKQKYLGSFDSPKDAALAYDRELYRLHGENGNFNFRNYVHTCEANNCESTNTTNYKNIWMCQKHKAQYKKYGYFLDRTIYDFNEIVEDKKYAYIILYNKSCEEIARTKIDIKNVKYVKNYKWYLRPDGYVATNNYNGEYTYLHTLICNKNSKVYVDHIDRDKLNNTEENLRGADGSENQMNKGIRSNNTSGKVGVHWSNEHNAWCAMICVRKNHINLGYFNSFEDAVACRVEAENKYFKDYKAIDETKKFVASVNERVVKGEI